MNTEEIKEIAEVFAFLLNNINQNVKFGPSSDEQKVFYIRQQINSETVYLNGKMTTVEKLINEFIGG